jgi:hypothetical protein
MRKLAFVLPFILVSMPVAAEDRSRCGLDAFGNPVCMDKDGVLSNAPPSAAISGKDDKQKGAAGKSSTAAAPGDKQGKPRCGTDPFGNTVCMNN